MHEIAWRKVCCPVDFSRESRAALEVAVDLCRRLGAELTILHVEEPDRADRGAESDAWLEEAAHAGIVVRSAVTRGDPKMAIAEWAEASGFDAIVMGTTGWTGRAHALVGSVAESTLRQAHCPVMVIHEEWARARLQEAASATPGQAGAPDLPR
jgi:nucleotide-binding universal stress UspA family protein